MAAACSAVAGIVSAAVSFVVLAHPTTPFVALRELPGVLVLSLLATAPGTLAVGLLTVALGPRSRLFRPGIRVLAGGVLGLAVMQCWGYLFGDSCYIPTGNGTGPSCGCAPRSLAAWPWPRQGP
jgi:hypothetical protein